VSVAKRALRTGLLLALVGTVGVAASRSDRLIDLTDEGSLTLTDQTRRIVDELDTDVEITAFLRHDEPGRVEAATLLDRYAELDRRIDWSVADPDESPGDVARLGVDPVLGGVAVRAGDHVELAATATEQDLTAALARVVRGRPGEVCVTTGHGEPALRTASALLEREGYVVRIVDLLSQPSVPESCTAVVLAGPTAPLGAASTALRSWVDRDGRLLALADPAAAVDLDPLLGQYGLGLDRGIVFEGDAGSVVGGDVTAPVVRTYSSGHPVVRRLPPTYFPAVQGVRVDDAAQDEVAGLTISRLADTSPSSYLETAPVEARFDPDADRSGPITVAAAAERTSNDGQQIRRTRLVVIGDVDFATDAFLGEAGNATLWARTVGWLTADDELAAISPSLPESRPLRLTDARIAYARVLTAGVVPALFGLSGALVWAARRRR